MVHVMCLLLNFRDFIHLSWISIPVLPGVDFTNSCNVAYASSWSWTLKLILTYLISNMFIVILF